MTHLHRAGSNGARATEGLDLFQDPPKARQECGAGAVRPSVESDLLRLAEKANLAHEEAEASWRNALSSARSAGEALAAAKQLVAHGGWLSWLADNCVFEERVAQMYMRISREWDRLQANPKRVSDLGIKAALGLLAKPRKPEPGTEVSTAQEAPAADDTAVSDTTSSHVLRNSAPADDVATSAPDTRPNRDPEPEEPVEEVGEVEVDAVAEWGRALKRIDELEKQIESMMADDKAAEIARLQERVVRLTGLVNGETETRQDAEKQATYYRTEMAKIRRRLGVERTAEVLAAIDRLEARAAEPLAGGLADPGPPPEPAPAHASAAAQPQRSPPAFVGERWPTPDDLDMDDVPSPVEPEAEPEPAAAAERCCPVCHQDMSGYGTQVPVCSRACLLQWEEEA